MVMKELESGEERSDEAEEISESERLRLRTAAIVYNRDRRVVPWSFGGVEGT